MITTSIMKKYCESFGKLSGDSVSIQPLFPKSGYLNKYTDKVIQMIGYYIRYEAKDLSTRGNQFKSFFKLMNKWKENLDSSSISGFVEDDIIFLRYIIDEDSEMFDYIGAKNGVPAAFFEQDFNDNIYIISFCKEEDKITDIIRRELDLLLHQDNFCLSIDASYLKAIMISVQLFHMLNPLETENESQKMYFIKNCLYAEVGNPVSFIQEISDEKPNEDVLKEIVDFVDKEFYTYEGLFGKDNLIDSMRFIQFLLENDIIVSKYILFTDDHGFKELFPKEE